MPHHQIACVAASDWPCPQLDGALVSPVPKLFGWLPKSRWLRWLVVGAVSGFLFLLVLGITGFFLFRSPKFRMWLFTMVMTRQALGRLEEPREPRLSPDAATRLATNALALRSAAELFGTTNVWAAHLRFTSNQWAALGPKRVPPVPGFIRPDGTIILRNPNAARAGVAGVLGFDFPWSRGNLEFGDAAFTNVAVRLKGNGTFLGAMRNHKRPFKVDLNKHVKSHELAGRTTLNFGNLSADLSFLSDALAYEFFREAGVPAPRTAFARLLLTIDGRFDHRLLGLYVVVENPDADWAHERFGVEGVALFKPVTYELFKDLGNDWKAYAAIYDPKTKTTPQQERRVIEFARLVTHAGDAEFAARVGSFLDLDEFARYFACEVMLANYDGILNTGQNYLIYLDPRTERFGFIPWDQDHSWGEFPLLATANDRERASIWHPWLGENRFLERMLAVETFRTNYRREVERLLAAQFVPEQLSRRLDEMAAVVRPFIAEESPRRLEKFERAVTAEITEGPRDGDPFNENRPVFQLKRFFDARAASVRNQLEGRVEGVVLTRRPPGGRGGRR